MVELAIWFVVGRYFDLLVGNLVVCLAGWLDDWCFDKLVGFLVEWLVFGWLVYLLVGCFF